MTMQHFESNSLWDNMCRNNFIRTKYANFWPMISILWLRNIYLVNRPMKNDGATWQCNI